MKFFPWSSEDTLHVITPNGVSTIHRESLQHVLDVYCRQPGPWQVVRDNGQAAATRREVK